MNDPRSNERHRRRPQSSLVSLCIYSACVFGSLAQPVHGQSKLVPLDASEAFAESFSLDAAIDYADTAALAWQRQYKCVTCHTNGMYLVARAHVDPTAESLLEVRNFASAYLKEYVEDEKKPSGQRGSIEGVVATTAFITIAEQQANRNLSDQTQLALHHIFERQDESGCWEDWLQCHWPPYEVDAHFGATIVGLAVGKAGASVGEDPTIQRGVERLRTYLQQRPLSNLHQKGMLMWASQHLDNICSGEELDEWSHELFEKQQDDGGWALVDIGDSDWIREDGTPQDSTSDAYATAFSLFVARQVGVPVEDPRLRRAVAWLKKSQRASGRWYVRSPRRDRKHFLSHAATNFAIMALRECEVNDEQP